MEKFKKLSRNEMRQISGGKPCSAIVWCAYGGDGPCGPFNAVVDCGNFAELNALCAENCGLGTLATDCECQ